MPEEAIYVIQKEGVFELVRERSRFAALSFCVHSLEESREKLKVAVERFPKATHYAYALRLGPRGDREFASDGGEPRGSAGRPILGALRRFMVTDTMVVVARYFGGKKLGIRGLIEAYGDAATKVLEVSGRVLYTQETKFTVIPTPHTFDAFLYRLLNVLRKKDGVLFDRNGGMITFTVPKDREESAETFLEKELLRGTITKFVKEG